MPSTDQPGSAATVRLFVSFMCRNGYGNAVVNVEHEPTNINDVDDIESRLAGHKVGLLRTVRKPHVLWWKVLPDA